MYINELIQLLHTLLSSPDWGGIGGIAGILSALLAVILSPPAQHTGDALHKKNRYSEHTASRQQQRVVVTYISPCSHTGVQYQGLSSQGDLRMENRRILVIDDNPAMHNLVRCIITCWSSEKHYQIELFSAYDGIQGLQQVQIVRPDMILLDLQMPRMDGQEVAQILRTMGDTTPILAMTGAHQDDIPAAFLANCNACLVKPFGAPLLCQHIEALKKGAFPKAVHRNMVTLPLRVMARIIVIESGEMGEQ